MTQPKHRRPPTLTIDPTAGRAYLMLGHGRVVRTVEYTADINLDLDRFGEVVGMEHTAIDATLPASEITKLFPTSLRKNLIGGLAMPKLSRINWPWLILSDIATDTSATRAAVAVIEKTVDDMKERLIKMAVNVEKLLADIQTLASGYQAVQAENAQLRTALASADADKAQAVADAVAAEDSDAQSKIDAADAIADAVLNPPAPEQFSSRRR